MKYYFTKLKPFPRKNWFRWKYEKLVNAKYYCNVLLKNMISKMNRLVKQNEYAKTELELTQPSSTLKC